MSQAMSRANNKNMSADSGEGSAMVVRTMTTRLRNAGSEKRSFNSGLLFLSCLQARSCSVNVGFFHIEELRVVPSPNTISACDRQLKLLFLALVSFTARGSNFHRSQCRRTSQNQYPHPPTLALGVRQRAVSYTHLTLPTKRIV